MNFIALLFALPAVLAVGTAVITAAEAPNEALPPWWRDERYVANGCFVSTSAYLQRLRREYPNVVARAASVRLPDGGRHTIAVVRWRNRNYGRDLFVGVFPIQGDVQTAFERALARWRAEGARHGYSEVTPHTARERAREIEAAAALVADARPQLICVPSSDGLRAVLTWTTAEGELALYEPTIGTAVGPAEYDPTLVARQLLARRG